MADAFIGEIRLFPYTYVPEGWLACNGQQVSIMQHQVLYAVIGLAYGGDGKTYFNVPQLQGRVAVGQGDDPLDIFDPVLASHGGAKTVTLSATTLPPHDHTVTGVQAALAKRSTEATGNLLTGVTFKPTSGTVNPTSFPYNPTAGAVPVPLHPATLSPFVGGTNGIPQPHENRQPALALQWCICATSGDFPPRP
jgi:microcystin-dependent protein